MLTGPRLTHRSVAQLNLESRVLTQLPVRAPTQIVQMAIGTVDLKSSTRQHARWLKRTLLGPVHAFVSLAYLFPSPRL